MKRNKHNNHLLRWLAIGTAVALLGIVVLQAYWLRTSYVEQKSRFRADVENALTAVLARKLVSASLDIPDMPELKGMEPLLSEAVATILKKVPAALHKDTSRTKPVVQVTMKGSITGSDSVDGVLMKNYLAKHPEMLDTHMVVSSLNKEMKLAPSEVVSKFKSWFDDELMKRAIKTKSALAIYDSSGRMITATCDTQEFKRIPVKSALTDPEFNKDGTRIQAAFPDANLYLLRRMSLLFSVTMLLMVLCCVSFAVLIRMFFRQKRLADIRNDFMNNMTHELKTPIASVSVALELMQDQRHPVSEEKKSEYLGIAQGELQRLSMLVEKVLKMAYFERGEIKIAPEPILAAAWLKNIVNSMGPVFEAANAKVSTRVQPELTMIYADKTHLTNVIQNLLENAMKYNGGSEPHIQIDILEEETSTVLSVTDNGKGIPSNYLDKVFDKFFRVPTGDRHDTKGYGLGLSYVKAIAELHGGSVTVSSVQNSHTTFTVKLPKKSN